jgi:hypothetical protein
MVDGRSVIVLCASETVTDGLGGMFVNTVHNNICMDLGFVRTDTFLTVESLATFLTDLRPLLAKQVIHR